jgi:transposase, IS30 family
MPTERKSRKGRIDADEREEISRGLAAGMAVTDLAASLGRRRDTLSAEIGRHGGRGAYRAAAAQAEADASASSRRSGKTRLAADPELESYVLTGLLARWSPEQIASRIAEDYPDDMDMRVSDEAIYRYVYVLPKGEVKAALVAGLRRERSERRPRSKSGRAETRGRIAEMLSIEERPAEVADRTVPGHWESDLVVGARNASAIATLVERVTRYTLLVPLPRGKDAAAVRMALEEAVAGIPERLRLTLTHDQGKELAEHRLFAEASGMTVYFAHPHSPWERGTNENTNGLVRQYFPKGTDFSKVTPAELRRVQDELNGRPRKVLAWRKPDEVFPKLIALR